MSPFLVLLCCIVTCFSNLSLKNKIIDGMWSKLCQGTIYVERNNFCTYYLLKVFFFFSLLLCVLFSSCSFPSFFFFIVWYELIGMGMKQISGDGDSHPALMSLSYLGIKCKLFYLIGVGKQIFCFCCMMNHSCTVLSCICFHKDIFLFSKV